MSLKIFDFTHNHVQKFASIAGGLVIEKSWGVPQAGGGVEIELGGRKLLQTMMLNFGEAQACSQLSLLYIGLFWSSRHL